MFGPGKMNIRCQALTELPVRYYALYMLPFAQNLIISIAIVTTIIVVRVIMLWGKGGNDLIS